MPKKEADTTTGPCDGGWTPRVNTARPSYPCWSHDMASFDNLICRHQQPMEGFRSPEQCEQNHDVLCVSGLLVDQAMQD